MSQTVLYFILLVFASFFLLKMTNIFLRYNKLSSKPTKRGLHKNPTTTSGGVFFIFYVAMLLFFFEETLLGQNLIKIFILLLFTLIFGIFDDKNNLSRRFKLTAQIVLSLIFIYFFNFKLLEIILPGINIDHIYIALNILFIIGFINFINFIDGSDGNLILFVIFIFICLISKLQITLSIDNYIYLIYFFPFLIIFYFFNINKKIFLGESGSFFLSAFLILNLNYYVLKDLVIISDILIISSYFIVDMIITFILRIYHYGKDSFTAHRDHAYQNFCYLKKNHKKLNLYMLIYNFLYVFPLYIMYVNKLISPSLTLIFCLMPSIYFVLKYSPLVKK